MNNNKTFRESRVSIPGQTAYRFAKGNTSPNYFIFVNNSNNVIYAGISPNISPTSFELVIPAMGTRTYARPDAPEELWFFATGDSVLYIGSMEKEFEPGMVSQTQEIASVGATGLLGAVDIRAMLNELPAGTQKIGIVEIDKLPELPAGNKLIGAININSILEGEILKPAFSVLVYNVETTLANTEYSLTIPDGTKKIEISVQENDAAFYVSFVSGKVATPTAPYIVKQAGGTLTIDGVHLVGKTLYFASAALKNIQVICYI